MYVLRGIHTHRSLQSAKTSRPIEELQWWTVYLDIVTHTVAHTGAHTVAHTGARTGAYTVAHTGAHTGAYTGAHTQWVNNRNDLRAQWASSNNFLRQFTIVICEKRFTKNKRGTDLRHSFQYRFSSVIQLFGHESHKKMSIYY